MIGTQLGLPNGTLDIIEYDYNKAVPCCNAMFKKWLEIDTSASWEKLFKVIESPAVSAPDRGEFFCRLISLQYAILVVHVCVCVCLFVSVLGLYTYCSIVL